MLAHPAGHRDLLGREQRLLVDDFEDFLELLTLLLASEADDVPLDPRAVTEGNQHPVAQLHTSL